VQASQEWEVISSATSSAATENQLTRINAENADWKYRISVYPSAIRIQWVFIQDVSPSPERSHLFEERSATARPARAVFDMAESPAETQVGFTQRASHPLYTSARD
jgi:hypothetical protein